VPRVAKAHERTLAVPASDFGDGRVRDELDPRLGRRHESMGKCGNGGPVAHEQDLAGRTVREEALSELEAIPEVQAAYLVTGSYDLMVRVLARDVIDDYFQVMNRQPHGFNGEFTGKL